MTKKEAQRFAERFLLPGLPGYVAAGDVVVRDDHHLIVRGFLFNRSQLDERRFGFRSWVQPLFVRDDVVSLALSGDLGEYRLPQDADGQRALSVQLLEKAETEQHGRLEIAGDYGRFEREVESLAQYGLAKVAALHLKGCAAVLDGRPGDADRWWRATMEESAATGELPLLAERSSSLLADLNTGADAAIDRLYGYARDTASALRLPLDLS
jgi:hypothetical protein